MRRRDYSRDTARLVSSSQPHFRVKFGRFFAKLEVQDWIAGSIGMNRTDFLTGRNLGSLRHRYGRKVAIHGDVVAMTHQHIVQSVVLEDGRHFTIEDGTCLGPCLATDINALVVQTYILGHGILAIASHNDIRAGDRHRQNALVLLEATRELPVFRVHAELVHRTLSLRFLIRLGLFGRFRTLLTGFFLGLLSGFLFRTFAGFLYFLFDETVYLRIQLIGRAAFLADSILNVPLFS